ncbi:tetratricopeptide repeat protein [Bradyrhizobium sp. CCH5-F6]|uniref:tetratricopeptide repeat protein n=1 Tax=Bradyrhizobium sp. CCH5-F6 TaxID=1768753 RepID=UPI000B019C63|nr:tetratricopeptide repeat protein [Bradyrhizobium sp. CCH5-F6]
MTKTARNGNRSTERIDTGILAKGLRLLFAASSLLMLCLLASPSAAQTSREFAREAFAAKDRKQFPLAIQLFNEAIKQGQFTPEQRGFILYGRGVSYDALGLRDLALGDFDAAIALLPDFPNSYVYRALAWSDRREFDKARDDLMQALRLNPTSALIHNNLGSVYERKGEVDRAIESYEEAIRLDPKSAQAFYNRAHAFIARQDYRAAISDYDRAIELQRDFADAYSNRGGMYLLLGDTDKAIGDFDEAIRLKGTDPIFWSNRASAYMTMGRYKDALADFDRAQSIDPGNPATYLGRGRARLYSDEIAGAIEDLRIAARLRPTNAFPAIWMHIARIHQGNPDREELERNAARVDRSQWPGQVLDFYLGRLDMDRVRENAGGSAGAEGERRLCEADFFVGEFLSHGRQKDDGRRMLRTVVDRCRPVDIIFAAAQAELREEKTSK